MSGDLNRLVKLAAAAVANEDEQWAFADGLVDEVPPERDTRVSRGNDGSLDLLQELSRRLEKDLGVRKGVSWLRQMRATALAWHPEDRDKDVSFKVHAYLRANPGMLAIYKKRAAADHKRSPGLVPSPKLTVHRLQVYRNDEKPPVPVEARMARAVLRIVNKALSVEELDAWETAFAQAAKQRRRELSGET